MSASVHTIEDGIFGVSTTPGCSSLGGVEFDSRVMEFCIKDFQRKNPDMKLTGADFQSKDALRKLREQCMHVQRTLSLSSNAVIEVSLKGVLYKCTLSKMSCMAVASCNVPSVIFVGGSTPTPYVKFLIQEFLKDGVWQNLDRPLPVVAPAAVPGVVVPEAALDEAGEEHTEEVDGEEVDGETDEEIDEGPETETDGSVGFSDRFESFLHNICADCQGDAYFKFAFDRGRMLFTTAFLDHHALEFDDEDIECLRQKDLATLDACLSALPEAVDISDAISHMSQVRKILDHDWKLWKDAQLRRAWRKPVAKPEKYLEPLRCDWNPGPAFQSDGPLHAGYVLSYLPSLRPDVTPGFWYVARADVAKERLMLQASGPRSGVSEWLENHAARIQFTSLPHNTKKQHLVPFSLHEDGAAAVRAAKIWLDAFDLLDLCSKRYGEQKLKYSCLKKRKGMFD